MPRTLPTEFDIIQLARATEGWTGSEIEQGFIDVLYHAFSRQEEPTDLSLMLQLGELVPLSRLMAEQITALRAWAKGRARLATKPAAASESRKILTAA